MDKASLRHGRERLDPVTSYMIPEGIEGLVGESSLGCEKIVEGLGSGRYVGLGRDDLSGTFGPGKWPSIWERGPGKWPVIREGPGWQARAGPKTLSLLSRGRPVLVKAGDGALNRGLRSSGRVVRGD